MAEEPENPSPPPPDAAAASPPPPCGGGVGEGEGEGEGEGLVAAQLQNGGGGDLTADELENRDLVAEELENLPPAAAVSPLSRGGGEGEGLLPEERENGGGGGLVAAEMENPPVAAAAISSPPLGGGGEGEGLLAAELENGGGDVLVAAELENPPPSPPPPGSGEGEGEDESDSGGEDEFVRKTRTLICALDLVSSNQPLPPEVLEEVSSIHRQKEDAEDGNTDDNAEGPNSKSIVPTNEDQNLAEVQIDTTELFTTSKIFNDRSEMIDWAKKVGRENDIVIVISKSHFSDPKRLPRMFLGCERGGKYRDHTKGSKDSSSERQISTKRCGCPFKLRCVKLNINEDKWRIEVLVGVHNHQLIINHGGHSFIGRLLDEEYEILQGMSKIGVGPREILSHLKGRDIGNASTLRTIYNARRKMRVLEVCFHTHMQQLLKVICDSGFVERHRVDPASDRIRDIFWAHPTSVDIVKAFPFVFMMDCTQKTKRYRLPLLEIVGVTSTNKTFSAAFVYMEAKEEENYTWALECFKDLFGSSSSTLPSAIVTDRDQGLTSAVMTVFPGAVHLFSRVHIERNVLTHCRNVFSEKKKWEEFFQAWTDIVSADTEDKYESKLYDLEGAFEEYPSILTYVRDTLRDKQRFVSAWVDRYLHFGNTSTNCIESSHAELRRYLGSSVQNFVNSWNAIKLLLDQQIIEIKASFEQSLKKAHQRFKAVVVKGLIGKISIAALEKLQVEIDCSKGIGRDPNSCNHVTHTTLGLPCAHMIVMCKRKGRKLPLSDVHPFWKKLSVTPFIDEHADEFDIFPEIETLYKKYKTFSDAQKLELKKHLRLLSDPNVAFLLETTEKANVRGRKKKGSERKDKSGLSRKRGRPRVEYAYEPIENIELVPLVPTQSSHTSSKCPEPVKPEKKRQKLMVHRNRNSEPPILFAGALPAPLLPFITDVTDVPSDGHCGFRVVAEFLGLDENGWRQVRRDLIGELDLHIESYTRDFYGAEHVAELKYCLRCQEKRAGSRHWMMMPDMGHLIASCYHIAVVYISMQQCFTFLPLWDTAPAPSMERILHIGYVKNCHFIRIHMGPDSPIPPVVRVWEKFHHDCASDWHTSYVDRIRQFRNVTLGTDVALNDTP